MHRLEKGNPWILSHTFLFHILLLEIYFLYNWIVKKFWKLYGEKYLRQKNLKQLNL